MLQISSQYLHFSPFYVFSLSACDSYWGSPKSAWGHTELFTQKVRMMKAMKGMTKRWDEGDDKMIQWSIIIPGKETVITAAVISTEMRNWWIQRSQNHLPYWNDIASIHHTSYDGHSRLLKNVLALVAQSDIHSNLLFIVIHALQQSVTSHCAPLKHWNLLFKAQLHLGLNCWM